MSRKEPKTLRVACFEDGRRKIISFKRGAYWWSQSEGAYPLSAALESIKEQGGWIETIPNPNYRPKGLFEKGTFGPDSSAKRKRKSGL
ncbi:hypothetical protein I5535_16100 [Rhodobacteraceae bacterium F11138]|nr:hypothetical protein [Rhodobacteraceae bacterium F11138]